MQNLWFYRFCHQNLSAAKSQLSTISRAPPPISSTASHAVDVACFMLEKLEDLSEQGLVLSIGVQSLANDANQPVACWEDPTRKFETEN